MRSFQFVSSFVFSLLHLVKADPVRAVTGSTGALQILSRPPASIVDGSLMNTNVPKTCEAEEQKYLTCLITQKFNDLNSCVDCINSAMPGPRDGGYYYCSDLKGYLCDAPSECGCDPCIEDIEDFYSCYYYFCDRDEVCTDEVPVETPDTVLEEAEATEETTDSTVAENFDCSSTLDSVTSCVDNCISSRRRLENQEFWEQPHAVLRGGNVQNAPKLQSDGGPFEIARVQGSSDRRLQTEDQRCGVQRAAYLECFALELSGNQMNNCVSCLNQSFPPQGSVITSCSAVETFLCEAPSNCNCGSCVDEIHAYNDCWYTWCDRESTCPSEVNTSECSSELNPMRSCIDSCFS